MKHTEYIIPIGEEAKEFDEIFIGVLRKHKELIRCKDCKHWDGYFCHNKWWGNGYGNYAPPIKKKEGFCDWAERKDEDGEIETWHSLKGNINAPKGTFDKIYEDDEL